MSHSHRQPEREPTPVDMDIVVFDNEQAAKLKALYDHYNTAALREGYTPELGEVSAAAMGVKAWQDHLAAETIDVILILAGADRPGEPLRPVSMAVAAQCVQETTGTFTLAAASVPPIYSHKARGFRPDVLRTGKECGFAAATFARAYGQAQDCCSPALRVLQNPE